MRLATFSILSLLGLTNVITAAPRHHWPMWAQLGHFKVFLASPVEGDCHRAEQVFPKDLKISDGDCKNTPDFRALEWTWSMYRRKGEDPYRFGYCTLRAYDKPDCAGKVIFEKGDANAWEAFGVCYGKEEYFPKSTGRSVAIECHKRDQKLHPEGPAPKGHS